MDALLTKLASIKATHSKQINWVQVNIPYNLKDRCREKFPKKIKWETDLHSWVVCETIADKFEMIYLDQFPTPTKEQKEVLKQSGCNFDKERKLYYMLKFQTIEEDV